MRRLTCFLLLSTLAGCRPSTQPPAASTTGRLALPQGFEATIFHDGVGRARHLAVTSDGIVYVKLRGPVRGQTPAEFKGLVALKDTGGDGRADQVEYFGDYEDTGDYGTGMRLYEGHIYFTTAGEVYRQKLVPGQLVPTTPVELVLKHGYKESGRSYEHIAKPISFDEQGHLYVPFGAPGDACQDKNRQPGAPGADPCGQLEWHGGVWQFDARKLGQTEKDGRRYATGIRSLVAMTWNQQVHELYAVQHGRDDLYRSWSQYFSRWHSAVLPSEEFFRVTEGFDGGWPYYYFDWMQGKKLLNPEYGGDGKKTGDGARLAPPLVGFPGHFAPNDLLFYEGTQFPERYRHGAFIAFHGSTIRMPYSQAGYIVAFVPMRDGRPSGDWEVFADGFAGLDSIPNTGDAAGPADGAGAGIRRPRCTSVTASRAESGRVGTTAVGRDDVRRRRNSRRWLRARQAGCPHPPARRAEGHPRQGDVSSLTEKIYDTYCIVVPPARCQGRWRPVPAAGRGPTGCQATSSG